MRISLIISASGLVAVLVLIYILSGIVVKPIAKNIEKQKRFITDAGHELKTPITVIDADAELVELDYGENEWLTDIKKQTKRLATLTKDLIYLSRVEEDGYKPACLDFPISDMISERAMSFLAIAKTKGKELELNIEPMLSFRGDEKSISQLVSLLMDNAIKYSDEQGIISLNLYKSGKSIVIDMYNTCEYVDPHSVERIFDRFYRADESRSRETGGYGIGLSIAKAIVTRHKGKIRAFTNGTTAITFKITL